MSKYSVNTTCCFGKRKSIAKPARYFFTLSKDNDFDR